mmetsp:Transcript_1304/g.1766  ORF Transcript_1304/g.1766 Transcript_1304/m.1766 type:complete len:208 (-) Transcript_1304:67-690(-)
MAGGLACYLSAWLFLGLSGIYCCYEEVNYNKKTQLFKLKKLEEETKTETTSADIESDPNNAVNTTVATGKSSKAKPKVVNVYEDMNTFSKVVRTVSYDEKLYGKNVYTGWIMISEGWVKIHDMQGNKLFDVEDVEDAPIVNIPPEVYYEPAENKKDTKIYPEKTNPPAPNLVPALADDDQAAEKTPWVSARNENPYAYASSNRQGQF